MRADAVVVGAGLAGLSAALRLAEAGRRVVVLAKGVGSLHLGGATIDVAGYAPERTASPRAGVEALAARPEHPYARLGAPAVERALAWLAARGDVPALVGGFDEHLLLPTAVGALKPSALAPASVAGGDAGRPGAVAIVGFPALKDFYPALCAENLRRAGIDARPLSVDANPTGQADPGALRFVAGFEQPQFRQSLVADLRGRLGDAARIGFPAVLGMDRSAAVVRELEDALERPVFEIPTLPPSIPGVRLYRALVRALKAAGGRIVVGSAVVGAERSDGRVAAVHADTSARVVPYEADWFVLATGGVSAGGLELDSYGAMHEPVLGLPVACLPAGDGPRFAEQYLDEQPLARAGVAVDDALRPVDGGGQPVLGNVRVAGATLAGAAPWREASGNGISLASGLAAADSILEQEGR